MKIIDRYLLRTLLTPLVYCLLAFTMLYLIVDLFGHLSDFLDGGTPLLQVLRFYALIVPPGMIYIAPISLLLAVLYSLSSLTRNNELTAMRAGGVSLYRLILPFLAVGAAASLAVSLVHETMAPWAAYHSRQFILAQRAEDAQRIYVIENLPYRNPVQDRTWLIGRFDTRTHALHQVEVIQHRPDGMDAYRMTADSGRWIEGRWWFLGVVVQPYDEHGFRKGAPAREAVREMTDLHETPTDFLNEIKDPEYLSAVELHRFIARHGLADATVARLRVDFHHRLASPWICLIVTLLGIPFGHQTGRRGALRGAMLALGLFFGFYVLISLGLWLGKQELLPPAAAGWGPNVLFAGLGVILVRRMR